MRGWAASTRLSWCFALTNDSTVSYMESRTKVIPVFRGGEGAGVEGWDHAAKRPETIFSGVREKQQPFLRFPRGALIWIPVFFALSGEVNFATGSWVTKKPE